MRYLAGLILISLAFCQSFEVASVRTDVSGSGHHGIDTDGNLLRMTNLPLKSAIAWAYNLTEAQILGPDWLGSNMYDITAKAESGAPKPEMLQALLKERFKMITHQETRDLPIYELVVAKNGPKLTKSADGSGGKTSSGPGRLSVQSEPMGWLALLLAGRRADLGRPVVDKTGLAGCFDFELKWTPDRDALKASADAPPSIFVALQEQLGLKLEARKGPVEVLVVDRVEKVPVEN